MDLVGEYSSSESSDDSVINSEPKTKVNKQVTKLIPRQVLANRTLADSPSTPIYDETYIELQRVKESKDELGDIFHLGSTSKQTQKNASTATEDVISSVERFKSKQLDESAKRTYIDSQSDGPRKKLKPAKQVRELDMRKFYKDNDKLIRTGELSVSEQVRKNTEVKYYGEGNNNLSRIIQFTEKNENRLEKEKSRKK